MVGASMTAFGTLLAGLLYLLLERADPGLYHAKHTGQARVATDQQAANA